MTARKPPAQMLTVAQAAKRLGVARQRVYELIHQGLIGHHRLAEETIRIPDAELDRYLRSTYIPARTT